VIRSSDARLEKLPIESDDVLAYQTGGLRSGLGPAVLGAAGVLLLAVAALIPQDHAAIIALVALVGIGLAVAGAVGAFRSLDRSGIILDRTRARVKIWRRAVVPMSTQSRELAEFWTVLLCMGRVQTRYASRTVYLVGLHGEVGEPIPLHWSEDYQAAKNFAEEIAAFLRFPFTDAAAVDIVVRTPGQASRPAHDTGPPPALIPRKPPPAGTQCRVSWRGPTLQIEEPRVRRLQLIRGPLLLFLLLGLPCLGLGVHAHFFRPRSTVFLDPLLAAAVAVGMLLVAFLAVVASSLPQLARRRVVEADPDALRFQIHGPFATTNRSIKNTEITELRIGLGHLCAITPRDYRVVCGRVDHPLSRAELEWLRDLMTRALHGATISSDQVREARGSSSLPDV
jgi:hypothetical protein